MSADTLHRLWEVQDELAAVRAELSALKARRCDGCAHWDQFSGYPRGDCSSFSYKGQFTETQADFSCAAWTEKP